MYIFQVDQCVRMCQLDFNIMQNDVKLTPSRPGGGPLFGNRLALLSDPLYEDPEEEDEFE